MRWLWRFLDQLTICLFQNLVCRTTITTVKNWGIKFFWYMVMSIENISKLWSHYHWLTIWKKNSELPQILIINEYIVICIIFKRNYLSSSYFSLLHNRHRLLREKNPVCKLGFCESFCKIISILRLSLFWWVRKNKKHQFWNWKAKAVRMNQRLSSDL